ncbi:hypothetical protein JCM5350_001865 [Sporobolomyces pararoseus]
MFRTSISRVARAVPRQTVARSASTSVAPVALNNIEASWKTLTPAEQEQTFKHLEELQKKDWKELSLDEKKASYYVAFGPHGPREPIQAEAGKTIAGVAAAVAVGGIIFYALRKGGAETPKTVSKEWQEASNEMLKEQKSDPFTGVTSKDYKGKGQSPVSPWPINRDPAANPHFLNTLRTSGVVDTSYIFNMGIDAILHRYESGLEAANFAEHSSEFCRANAIQLTADSSIGFFRSNPPSGPFVRAFVDRCPLAHSTTESARSDNEEAETTWTMIDTDDIPPGQVEYVVHVPR